MAERVEITGNTELSGAVLQNAASEATLLRLLAAVEKMSSGPKAAANSAKVQQLAAESQNKNTDEVKKGTAQTKVNTNEMGKFGKAVDDTSSRLASFAKNAFTGTLAALGGLTSELLTGGDRFSDFTKHLSGIPVVGTMLNTLAGFLDKNIDIYRNLSQVGATFGNDLFEMRRAAAEAGMPLDKFAAAIQQNSNLLAVFGASTSDGARRFGEVSKGLRTGRLGQQLMAMGFTAEDVNDTLLSYMDIQSRNGRLESMSTTQLAQEAGEYAMEMDRLSRLTGIQRKELEKAVQANQTDARMRSMRSKLEGDALKNFDANMAMVDKQMPGLSGALKDLADGVANTEEGQKLLAIGGTEFADLMTKAGKGLISPEELQNGLAKLAPRLEQYGNSIGEAGLQSLQKTQPALYAVLSNAHELNRLTQKNNAALSEEQKRREAITSFLGQFEQVIANIRGAIETSILKSAVFERLKKLVGDFAKTGGSAMEAFAKKLPPLIDSFLLQVEKYLKMFNDPDMSIGDVFKEMFKDAASAIGSVLADAFMALLTSPKVILALVAAIGVMGAMAGAKAAVASRVSGLLGGAASAAGKGPDIASRAAGGIGAGVGKGAEAAGAGIGKGLEGLAKGAGAIGTGVGKAIEGVIRGIAGGLSALANPAALIGLGAVTLAINGLAAALRIAEPALEPFGKMVQSMFEGLGTAVEKFAPNFTSLFNGIAEVIKSIGNIITGTISSVADGIGNIIGKITEYKSAGVDATTAQIERLSAIPSDNMSRAAESINAMKVALEGFSPGLMSGLSTGLGSMFGGDQAERISKIADAGVKLQPIGGYITSVSDGLKTFDTVNFESIEIGTKKLLALSQQVNATSDSFKKIEAVSFDKITEKISSVTASLKEVGSSITDSVASALGIGGKKTQEQLLTDVGDKLERLNIGMNTLINVQQGAATGINKTAKYAKQSTGNMI